ncbi:hypothetical protein [Photorhabdus caribbeanensis]|nr:hypothetical protein [Photorhabdus caribbeanensis]
MRQNPKEISMIMGRRATYIIQEVWKKLYPRQIPARGKQRCTAKYKTDRY